MKKICLTLFALSFSLTGFSQQKHEIRAGAGTMSYPYIKDAIRPGIEGIWDKYSTSGIFHASYKYYFNKHRSLGLSYSFEHQKHTYSNSADPNDNLKNFFTHNYHTVMLHYAESWLNRKFIHLYSNLAFGFSYCRIKNTRNEHPTFELSREQRNRLAYQLTPIGIRVGTKIGGYAELGYGYQGILCAGLSYRF